MSDTTSKTLENETTEIAKKEVKTTKKTAKLPKITVKDYKKIIFLGSEAAPFIATGGLADVLGSLPKELAKNKSLDISVTQEGSRFHKERT